jgi:hypothetical protein
MQPDLSVLPITGWEVETVSTDELIFVRFIFLSDILQRLDEADIGNSYAMEIEQARELRNALTRAIERIDNEHEHSSRSHCDNISKTRR